MSAGDPRRLARMMSVNNLFEVAFVRRGARGTRAASASQDDGLQCEAACERLVFTELKSVVWTDFQKGEEV